MAITTATAQIRGPRNWMRIVLSTVGLVLLLAVPQPAGAEKIDPMAAATQQARNCELLGGEATVETHRTPGGNNASEVSCEGGMADGIGCYNMEDGTYCFEIVDFVAPVNDWHVDPVAGVELMETGSLRQIEAALAAYDADVTGYQARMAAADDEREQHRDVGKHGKGKHGKGKQGGKHRKR